MTYSPECVSEALEALERLHLLAISDDEDIAEQYDEDSEWFSDYCAQLRATIRAALEQPSTAEKCYVCGGNDGIRGKHGIYCERTIIEGRFPWKPSTAEAQARALEDAAKKIRLYTTDTPEYNPHFIAAFLDGRAKRIREEG